MIQCEHGFHHSDAPHSCDWVNHFDECPWRSSKLRRLTEPAEDLTEPEEDD